MKHYGDITKLNGAELPIVDVITGGSPCQDLSVAGKRAGLAGERSGLFMEQIRIIKEMRDECIRQVQMRGSDVDIRRIRPRYMVWENVPGAFSSNGGEDFHAVLEETAKVADKNAIIPRLEGGAKWTPSGAILADGWSIAWRVHDAQFWGVPQRRKRIALVADFGGSSAPEILFERKGMSGNPEQIGEKGQTNSRTSKTDSLETISFQERAGCEGGARGSLSNTNEQEHCQPSIINPSCNSSGEDIAGTLDSNYYKGCGERQGIEREVVCVSQDAYDKYSESDKAATIKQSGGIYGGVGSISDTVGALCRADYKGVGNQYVADGKCIIQNISEDGSSW